MSSSRSRTVLVAAALAVVGFSGCSQAVSPAANPAAAPPSAAQPATTTAAAPTTEAAEEMEGADADVTGVPADPGSGTVTGPDVAQSVSTELTRIVGRSPDAVTCPDLPGTVGAAIRCTLDADGVSYGVTVTVTSVEGADVQFDIQVDDQPS
jgi:hypothetical protein